MGGYWNSCSVCKLLINLDFGSTFHCHPYPSDSHLYCSHFILSSGLSPLFILSLTLCFPVFLKHIAVFSPATPLPSPLFFHCSGFILFYLDIVITRVMGRTGSQHIFSVCNFLKYAYQKATSITVFTTTSIWSFHFHSNPTIKFKVYMFRVLICNLLYESSKSSFFSFDFVVNIIFYELFVPLNFIVTVKSWVS